MEKELDIETWKAEQKLAKLREPISKDDVAWVRRTASRLDWKFKRGKSPKRRS